MINVPIDATASRAEPQIGLFWGLPDAETHYRLIGLFRPVSAVPEIGGFKTLDDGHVDIWPTIIRQCPDLRGVPYEHYPRGRVNWRAEDGMFLLLMDRKLMTRAFIDEVITRLALPEERLITMTDQHYVSPY